MFQSLWGRVRTKLILIPGLLYYSTRKSLCMRLGSLHLCVSEILFVLVGRYFGSAEGSKFVEMASVDNVKRTMVWLGSGVTPYRDRWEEGRGCGYNSSV